MSPTPLVLASASPRRAEILAMLGVRFRVRSVPIEERRRPGEAPAAYVERLAREKAAAARRLEPDVWVLGGDTTVALGDEILEKPRDEEDAVRMLVRLAGREHEVWTALALASPGGEIHSRVDRSRVRFRAFTEPTARAYVATGEPLDKAGAYGIQGKGAALVESVHGDFFTVMGLPVSGLVTLLDEAGRPFRFAGNGGPSPFGGVAAE